MDTVAYRTAQTATAMRNQGRTTAIKIKAPTTLAAMARKELSVAVGVACEPAGTAEGRRSSSVRLTRNNVVQRVYIFGESVHDADKRLETSNNTSVTLANVEKDDL